MPADTTSGLLHALTEQVLVADRAMGGAMGTAHRGPVKAVRNVTAANRRPRSEPGVSSLHHPEAKYVNI
ncbi:MAG: hypothetical protein GEV28_02680 [Actinophytocola sp.]|uniref:hypothetical protein n=1 Tax=Actinophytocola sp. TaxID=1872138 RepID=UPI001327F7D8|nr:hypothetical protein [Actinophytocola sp.]MPZ79341.1 hypothetical protein [Actinophytocola sp.]